MNIDSGTFNVTMADEPSSYSGKITSATFNNNSNGGASLFLLGTVEQVSFPTSNCGMIQGSPYRIDTHCSTSNTAAVAINTYYETQSGNPLFLGFFQGLVECPAPLGGTGGETTTQSMTAGTTQDSDGDRDGIPDFTDRCTHNSNPMCFKEGDTTSTTTTTQQEQPSSNRTGNQTG